MTVIHDLTSKTSSEKSVSTSDTQEKPKRKGKILSIPSLLLLPQRMPTHHVSAGLNPLADAASRLFTIMGRLDRLKIQNNLAALQKELIKEILQFIDSGKSLGYDAEYLSICQYVLSATYDDLIPKQSFAQKGEWASFRLIDYFKCDSENENLFFLVLERTLKEPNHYIDLMELMYLCLNFGYQGPYRDHPNCRFALDLISDNLFKHIRSFRRNFNKRLSPVSLKIKESKNQNTVQRHVYLLISATILMILIFAGLRYIL